MAQSKRRTARKSGKGRPRKPADEARPANGILVQLVDQPNGDRQITVGTLGDVKLTEAPTLLRMAAKNTETQLGIE
jgi:hypothetical protein